MGFRERIYRFMYGRYITYGMDRFTYLLLGICIILSVVNLFLRSSILSLVETAVFIFLMYRLLSRNIVKRQNENRKILNFTDNFLKIFRLEKRKFKERETHIYKNCPHCRVTLRLPKRTGKHTVRCPRCKGNFEVKVR